MNEVKYKLAESGEFIIENFNKAKAFSSFFPGIAGLDGIPLWAFYVNRGQCVSSFGTKDKSGAIVEFLPANQAYALTSLKGFRTFLKVKKGDGLIFHEPFSGSSDKVSGPSSTKMIISPCKLEIEEINPYLGILVNVLYMTIPGESFAALARRVTITNLSKKRADIEAVDGLTQIVSFGITEELQKHLSRTIEAWIKVSNIERKAPFYALKVNPQDKPQLEYIERGNFYLSYEVTDKGTDMLAPIVDPDIVFGSDGDISYPRVFAEAKGYDLRDKYQRTECKTPSAFAYSRFGLKPGQSKKIVSIIGNVRDVKELNSLVPKIKDAAYFDKKYSENEDIIGRLENRAFTNSSSRRFDNYCRQTFLDNLIRGGFPVSIDTPSGPFVFYAYARKHGDLERDYNSFLLEPSHYSQGNGTYRDINQNRRNDTLFNPQVRYDNLLTFINAIQPDGFNPQLLEGITLSLKSADSAEPALKRHIKDPASRRKLRQYLSAPFTPGGILCFLEREGILSGKKAQEFLKHILSLSVKSDVIKPGEGYWVDHWTYNLDLIESYLFSYPEDLAGLLFNRRDFTFYDTYLRVNSRDEKYVYVDGKIRQFGSVQEDEVKKRFIEARASHPHKMRIGHGKGEIYKTSLFVKLACILANKVSSLDPFGIGIEMEADKPGWCDSLNNLPGIFGSSVSETFELKRLILFLRSSLECLGPADAHKVSLPYELSGFLTDLRGLLDKDLSTVSKAGNFDYWNTSSGIKERYRQRVWYGFDGKERPVSIGEIKEMLDKFLLKLERGLKAARSGKNDLPYTYFINEVKDYNFIYENGRRKLNKDGLPLVEALSFSHKPISLFLEGPVHAMRVAEGSEEPRSLYKAVRKSELFDAGLKMYKLNAPLRGMPFELGRQVVFTPGWLENESIWLHMEYKYLLEVLKKGLYEEFFSDLKNCLVAFQNPARYGRSILENSSFIASSAFPDNAIRGNGFVARLSGSTTEFLTMWLLMCLGRQPFKADENGGLSLELEPVLPGWLFTEKESISEFYFNGGGKRTVGFSKNVFACCLFGKTLLVYHNPKRRDTFGRKPARPISIVLKRDGEEDIGFTGNSVPSPFAERAREGYYDRIDVTLS